MGRYANLHNAFTQVVRRIIAHQPIKDVGGCPPGKVESGYPNHCSRNCVDCWEEYLCDHEFVVAAPPSLDDQIESAFKTLQTLVAQRNATAGNKRAQQEVLIRDLPTIQDERSYSYTAEEREMFIAKKKHSLDKDAGT